MDVDDLSTSGLAARRPQKISSTLKKPPTKVPMTSVIQINFHQSGMAKNFLVDKIIEGYIGLIREPWTVQKKISGRNHIDHQLFCANARYRPKTCKICHKTWIYLFRVFHIERNDTEAREWKHIHGQCISVVRLTDITTNARTEPPIKKFCR